MLRQCSAALADAGKIGSDSVPLEGEIGGNLVLTGIPWMGGKTTDQKHSRN